MLALDAAIAVQSLLMMVVVERDWTFRCQTHERTQLITTVDRGKQKKAALWFQTSVCWILILKRFVAQAEKRCRLFALFSTQWQHFEIQCLQVTQNVSLYLSSWWLKNLTVKPFYTRLGGAPIRMTGWLVGLVGLLSLSRSIALKLSCFVTKPSPFSSIASKSFAIFSSSIPSNVVKCSMQWRSFTWLRVNPASVPSSSQISKTDSMISTPKVDFLKGHTWLLFC